MVHVVFEETSKLCFFFFFFVLQTLSVMPPRQAPLKYTVYGFLVINKHEKKTYYKINKCYNLYSCICFVTVTGNAKHF